ncbi:hypothetical protein OG439_16005 [Amycolatopsis sp. NBC_01307]|uniref:hypothetical protein n=1 Tax=Amycolatopsis sp. NBC_01307 TaxID=2903561 RepID=UPI002E0D8E48|nr:hypothetical protein OG439_16005 [Amycolatopsis sp. NBC_01307]
MEGPFLSPKRAGTHPAELLRAPDTELTERLLAAGSITQVTLAPELPGALELVVFLVRTGVRVSCGHSDAAPGWSPTSSTRCGRSPTATPESWARH